MVEHPRGQFLRPAASVAALPSLPLVAAAHAAHPSRPIRFIIGLGAGGGTDIMTRLIGAKLSQIPGQFDEEIAKYRQVRAPAFRGLGHIGTATTSRSGSWRKSGAMVGSRG